MDSNREKTIKLVILGDKFTGKTIFSQFFLNGYENLDGKIYIETVGASYGSKHIEYNNDIYCIDIWDTGGTEKYTALTGFFVEEANIVFIFYDYFDKQTFERAKFWFSYTKERNEPNIPIFILVANKYDLCLESKDNDNIIPDEEAIEFAEANNILFAHLSLKEKYSNGIKELFDKALKEFFKKEKIS